VPGAPTARTPAKVQRMPEKYSDPSNTQAFQAFVERDEPAPPARPAGLIIAGAVVAALIVLAAVVWLVA
jgi:hypothetical protein